MPTIHHHELSPGDDLGLNATPHCCGTDMQAKDVDDGGRDYTCGECDVVLSVAPSGLVFDITA